jgi:hypothetical protein
VKPLIRQPIFVFRHDADHIQSVDTAGLPLSAKDGHTVKGYRELLRKIAQLNFYNPGLDLFFRGQRSDHQVRKSGKYIRSNLYPKILRGLAIPKERRSKTIAERVSVLKKADAAFLDEASDAYIHRQRLARWAILQHYEVCATPLLDVTSSLQVALSFAVPTGKGAGYLFAFGLPTGTGPISTSIETMTQVVNLTKICPPDALRPHFQCAMFLVDYPLALDPDDLAARAPRVEANFACRLLTKFHLPNVDRWQSEGFVPIQEDVLYPNDHDVLYSTMERVKETVAGGTSAGDARRGITAQ